MAGLRVAPPGMAEIDTTCTSAGGAELDLNAPCNGLMKKGCCFDVHSVPGSHAWLLGRGAFHASPTAMSCKQGGSWTAKPDVANSAQGFHDCATHCSYFKYLSLECPRTTAVHCRCSNDISTSTSVDAANCQTVNADVPGSHCVGPFQQWDHAKLYDMGGHGYGSVYTVHNTTAAQVDLARMYAPLV